MKSKAVEKFKELKTVKQVQSFLGLNGYFRKFIGGYAFIFATRNDVQSKFEEKERVAFEMLKKMLS